MDFPVNRDGWSGPGRTKARWLKDTLDTPYSKAQVGSGGESATAYHKNGFLEVEVESEAKTEYFITMTRQTIEAPRLAASRRLIRSLVPTPKNWATVSDHPDTPPGTFLSRYYFTGAYSMGGNGAVFYLAPVADNDAYDRWSRQLIAGEYLDVPVPQVEVGVYLRPPGEQPKRLHTIKCVAFRASESFVSPTEIIGQPYPGFYFGGLRVTSEYDGKVYNNSEPTMPYLVEGARTIDGYQAAIGFTTLNADGDYVARVQVFNNDGVVVQRDLAHAPNRPVRLDGLWRLAPKTYLAVVSRMFHAGYGSMYENSVPPGDRVKVYDDARAMKDIPPLGENEQRTFFMRSTDGGVTWLKLPENELLRPSNELARWAASGTMPYEWSGSAVRVHSSNQVNGSIPSAFSAVPVSDGRVFIQFISATEWKRIDSGSGDLWYSPTDILCGVYDIFTGHVSSMTTVLKGPDPSPAVIQGLLGLTAAGARIGGAFHMPGGGVGYLVRDQYSGADLSGQHYWLYSSTDKGQTFPGIQRPPMDWMSSRTPYVLGRTQCATWLGTAPTTFTVMYFGKTGWKPATSNIGSWWLPPLNLSQPTHIWNIFDRWTMGSLGAQPFDCIGRVVRPFHNPTPSAPWISDHRISYA